MRSWYHVWIPSRMPIHAKARSMIHDPWWEAFAPRMSLGSGPFWRSGSGRSGSGRSGSGRSGSGRSGSSWSGSGIGPVLVGLVPVGLVPVGPVPVGPPYLPKTCFFLLGKCHNQTVFWSKSIFCSMPRWSPDDPRIKHTNRKGSFSLIKMSNH